jgi:flagellar hook-associated protein 3 FlgL
MLRISTNNMYLTSDAYISTDQSAMMTTEAELASGKQVNSPSDNPVGAAQAALLQSNESQLGQYASNQTQATQFLNNGSSTMTQAINVLQSVNSSLVAAGNATLSTAGRSAIASQLQQELNQLVGLANTSDNEGGYLFGGSVTSGPPFVQNGNSVTYAGDNLEPSVQISQTRNEQIKYSGASVFMQIPTGNGTFETAPGTSNTGSGAINVGTVTTPSALTGDNYTITMGTGGTSYQVQDTTTGATVASGSYTNPTTLSFDGMQVQLSGTPAAGDTFTVAPAGYQSVFSTIAGAITALQAPTGTTAEAAQNSAALSGALNGVGQALTSLTTTQASMGSQLAELQTYSAINSDQNVQDQTQSSAIVDLDYAQGVSQLSQQQTEYQAALQSYASISKLSLFNYIS